MNHLENLEDEPSRQASAWLQKDRPTEEEKYQALWEESMDTVFTVLSDPSLLAGQDFTLEDLPAKMVQFFHESGGKVSDLTDKPLSDEVYENGLKSVYDETEPLTADGYALAAACFRHYSAFTKFNPTPDCAKILVDKLMPLAMEGKLDTEIPDKTVFAMSEKNEQAARDVSVDNTVIPGWFP